MVSFQCDGCSDVVKKPKLDQHRLRCKASFTCIDCSKTFPTPADWKGHTSCISEAEKYQKSLFKPKNNHDRAGNANERRDSRSRNANNASWNKGFSRSKATGANDTPLGTPVRMSPLTTTENEANPPTPNTIPKTVETTTSPKGQKRKADEISSSDPSASLIPSDGVKEEIKSSKKRKSNTKKDLDKAKTGADANTSNEVTSEDKADADKKKGKKSKKETDKMNVDGSNTTADNGFTQKDKKAPGEEEVASTLVQMEDKSNHENSDVRIEKSEKKTKRKSTKKEKSKEENGDENAEPDKALSVKKKEKKKQKIDEDDQDNLETKNMYIEKEASNIDESSEANTKQEKSKNNKTRKHAESKDKTSDKSEMVAKKKKKTKE